jgi:hypothetical protein
MTLVCARYLTRMARDDRSHAQSSNRDLPNGTLCARCQENEATVWWAGEMGMLAVTHGFMSPWCERCSVEKQAEHAREVADRLVELEARLQELGGPFSGGDPEELDPAARMAQLQKETRRIMSGAAERFEELNGLAPGEGAKYGYGPAEPE